MKEYVFDKLVDQRAKTFALWLEYEAEQKPMMQGIQNVFLAVGESVQNQQPVEQLHSDLLYGVIKGHAKAWRYLKDYQDNPKLYLTHYIVAVMEKNKPSP